jgi:hypothetical protein
VTETSAPAAGSVLGDLTDQLINTSLWSDEMVASAGIPIVDVPLVSVGGGLGSFALVDHLRIAGVPPSSMRVLTVLDFPYQTYRYLATNSQIPDGERLRSDSASVMDNVWGWPSYAFREAAEEKGFSRKFAPLWNVFTEPILTDYWTPRSDQVFRSVDRESRRIQWPSMLAKGQVRMVRKRYGGGYFTILTPPQGVGPTKRVAVRSSYVHVSVGYPGLRFLDDLQAYRQNYRDYTKVVNAYEPHEHVYEELKARPGVVVVRGNGIVGSRILQRLIDDRDHFGAQTTIWHLFRHHQSGPEGPLFFRRRSEFGTAIQGFNFCKAAWGGQTKFAIEKLEGDARAAMVRAVGGTNTPRRKLWREQLSRGLREGWYRQHIGEVADVVPGPNDTIVTRVRSGPETFLELPANFIVDGTGLEADIREHRLLADLLDHCGAGKNPAGRLDVERWFEVRGTVNLPGKVYASGTACVGGYFAPCDSFLGLQYVALQIADDLARQGFCPKIGPGRSVGQWFKWAANTPI